jgi:hypothetical protein
MDEVLAPATHIMPELMESCDRVVRPSSFEEVRSSSHEISVVSSPPSHAFALEKSDVVDDAVSLLHVSGRHVILFGDRLLS